MATLKGIKRAARSESLSGKIMVDTVRGVLRVRKWPKKRGTPKSASQRWWNDWFRQANLLAKYVDAATMRKAIELTAGTGMYPRDIILKAMRGRLYIWQDQTGKVWHPMAAIQDISESLDVLAQGIGSVLFRASDRWRALDPGVASEVLTSAGPDALPTWEAPVAPGAGLGCLLTNTANWSIPGTTWTPLTWNTEAYDDAAFHDLITNTNRITMPVGATRVQFNTQVTWNNNATGVTRVVAIAKNGSIGGFPGAPFATSYDMGGTAWVRQPLPAPIMSVIAGDYFDVHVRHDGVGNVNLLSAESHFSCIINP